MEAREAWGQVRSKIEAQRAELGAPSIAGYIDPYIQRDGQTDEFSKLKDLITSTIEPEGWDTSGDKGGLYSETGEAVLPALLPESDFQIAMDRRVEPGRRQGGTGTASGFGVDLSGGIDMAGSLNLDAIQGDADGQLLMKTDQAVPADESELYRSRVKGKLSPSSTIVTGPADGRDVEELLKAAGEESSELVVDESDIKARARLEPKDGSADDLQVDELLATSVNKIIDSEQELTIGGLEKEDMLLVELSKSCLLYTSPSPRDRTRSRMPSSA